MLEGNDKLGGFGRSEWHDSVNKLLGRWRRGGSDQKGLTKKRWKQLLRRRSFLQTLRNTVSGHVEAQSLNLHTGTLVRLMKPLEVFQY